MKTVIECPVCHYNAKFKVFNIYSCSNCKCSYKIVKKKLYILDKETAIFIPYYGEDNETSNQEERKKEVLFRN